MCEHINEAVDGISAVSTGGFAGGMHWFMERVVLGGIGGLYVTVKVEDAQKDENGVHIDEMRSGFVHPNWFEEKLRQGKLPIQHQIIHKIG